MSLNAPPATAELVARIDQLEQAIVALSAEVDIARAEARSAQRRLEGEPALDGD